MQETRNQSLFSLLGEYRGVFKKLLHTPETLYTLGFLSIMFITSTITNTFWGIIAVEKIHIPAENIAYFSFLRSVVMLVFFFGILPHISHFSSKLPMVAGYVIFIIGQVILVLVPDKNYGLLILSVVLDAGCVAMVGPQVDKLSVVTVDPEERARILALLYMGMLIITAPFGWIAGNLSSIDKAYPFILNIGFYSIGLMLTFLATRTPRRLPAK